MTIQLSEAVRNARLDATETQIGTGAIVKLFTGAQPANCAAADSGTVVSTMTLASDWMAAAATGAKAKAGTWEDLTADNAGTVGHFRVYASNGTTCGIQGSVTNTGGGGDMTLDNNVVAANQKITVTGFTLTDGNA